jgi:hypothetical protein
MDSSWQIRWADVTLVLDPWLIGSEIDGFSWFNEQWHTTEPIAPADLGQTDLLIVSQPYSDHCHSTTIKELSGYKELLAVKPARKRLEREIKGIKIKEVPDVTLPWYEYSKLKIAMLRPDKLVDPIYNAIIIACGTEAILYSPHGFMLNEKQLAALKGYQIKLLITTFTYFKIPAILGGIVNPGMAAVKQLADQIQPVRIINTHDEQKRGRGLIGKLAQALYADVHAEQRRDARILPMPDYSWLSL